MVTDKNWYTANYSKITDKKAIEWKVKEKWEHIDRQKERIITNRDIMVETEIEVEQP